MALLHSAAKFDPFLALDCAPTPRHNPRQGKDQILPSGNLGHAQERKEGRHSAAPFIDSVEIALFPPERGY